MVKIEIETGTLATLIAGLYTANTGVDVQAIPPSVYLQVAVELIPYLKDWDYDKISFEDWIRYNLMIYPKVMFNEDELNEFKENDIYIELIIGNAVLIATAEV